MVTARVASSTSAAHPLFLSLLALVVGLLIAPGPGHARDGRPPNTEWPNPLYPTFQSAVDATPEGGTLEIKPGEHTIDQPIFIRGRHLVIAGAGSGRKSGTLITRLIGPPPQPVVRREGSIEPRAEQVVAMFNLTNAEVEVRDLWASGFDAFAVSRDDDAGNSAHFLGKDLFISDTGRGVMSQSTAGITVQDTTIQDVLWNGISAKNALVFALFDVAIHNVGGAGVLALAVSNLSIQNVAIFNAKNTGLFVVDSSCFGIVQWVKGQFNFNEAGGIVAIRSCLRVGPSNLFGNTFWGIAAFGSDIGIKDTVITNTQANAQGAFGDGIVLRVDDFILAISEAEISDVLVTNPARAGIANFGSTAHLKNTRVQCPAFDFQGADFLGFDYTLHDEGGNKCGCPLPTGSCIVAEIGLEPPGPIEAFE